MGLNEWLHKLHLVTGGMVLHWINPKADLLREWAKRLREVAREMEAKAKNERGQTPRKKARV